MPPLSDQPPAPVVAEIGSLAGVADPAVLPIRLRPHHPSAHGLFRLRLALDGQHILAADPVVGFVHRGAEKLFEVRDYRQVMMLANRHDWLAGFGSELGVALAVEEMLGLEVPERATWLRTALAEIERVHAHLVFLGEFPVGAATLADLGSEPEAVQALVEAACGTRIHPMYARIGGLREDVPRGWFAAVRGVITAVRSSLPGLRARLDQDDIAGTLAGAGIVDASTAASFGVTGPVARAGGLDLDLRRDDPYLAYDALYAPGGPGRVVTDPAGDVPARLRLLVDQIAVSLDLVDECLGRLERLPAGPVSVRLPKSLRPPEGDGTAATENPGGVNGYYIRSRGGTSPARVKLRTAGFATVQSLSQVLPGTRIDQLTAVLASLLIVVGDVDK